MDLLEVPPGDYDNYDGPSIIPREVSLLDLPQTDKLNVTEMKDRTSEFRCKHDRLDCAPPDVDPIDRESSR